MAFTSQQHWQLYLLLLSAHKILTACFWRGEQGDKLYCGCVCVWSEQVIKTNKIQQQQTVIIRSDIKKPTVI